MHHYSAYGLSIRSHRPIPELPAGKAPSSFPVVSIRWNAVDAETDMSSGPQTAYRVRPESLCIRFHDLGAFLIEPDRITVDPLPGASLEAVRLMLVGSVLGLFLRRRGLLTLHGNAVACEAGAAVVLGASGAGKSTLTAALHRRGFRFISDDVSAIDLAGPEVLLLPGLPRLKLWPDTAALFAAESADLPRAHPGLEKRIHTVASGLQETPHRLLLVYVLEPGEATALSPIPPSEALVEMIRHAHLPRSLPITGDDSRHFEQSAELVRRIPVRRIVRAGALDRLPELLDLIEADLSHAARR